ncbi:MAG: hypothetical protein R2939_20560 [Kofleriaceae bacterium]
MKPELMLELLEAAASQLAIKVSYESLAASVGHGGLCRVKGQYRVIVDKRATPQERVAIVASALASFDLSELELPAKVREVVRFHEGSARIKLAAPVAEPAPAAPAVVEAAADAADAVPGSYVDPITGKTVAA